MHSDQFLFYEGHQQQTSVYRHGPATDCCMYVSGYMCVYMHHNQKFVVCLGGQVSRQYYQTCTVQTIISGTKYSPENCEFPGQIIVFHAPGIRGIFSRLFHKNMTVGKL